MRYAKVVVGIPVEGPFDYFVPEHLEKKIKKGVRIKIDFANRNLIGYVVGFSLVSKFKKIKPVLKVLDDEPIVNDIFLKLTRRISEYYGCSWGEAIEVCLPDRLRKGALLPGARKNITVLNSELKQSIFHNAKVFPSNRMPLIIQEKDYSVRWNTYLEYALNFLRDAKSVIILVPDIMALESAFAFINQHHRGLMPIILHRHLAKEIEIWNQIRNQEYSLVLGTRSAVFAPVRNLGLMIVDEEIRDEYKQDQTPHYHAVTVAILRMRIEKTSLVLGGNMISLERIWMTKKKKAEFFASAFQNHPAQIKILDLRKEDYFSNRSGYFFSNYARQILLKAITEKRKSLVFFNRQGFATLSRCQNCGYKFSCPRCQSHLVFYYNRNLLACRHCNYKISFPKICPNCNSGYVKFYGVGLERVGWELEQCFPQARIKRIDGPVALDLESADIFISTSMVFKFTQHSFQLPAQPFDYVVALGLDYSLNRIDFRAQEKTMHYLVSLLNLTRLELVIETFNRQHHCFLATEKKDIDFFYERELEERKELDFPPFKHLCLIKIRGKDKEKTRLEAERIYNLFSTKNTNKGIKLEDLSSGIMPKLRGNFYYQFLAKSSSPFLLSKFVKQNLNQIRTSKVTVTVDMDPV